MVTAVLADDVQWNELTESCGENLFVRLQSVHDRTDADIYLLLDENCIPELHHFEKPVVLNSVIKTLSDLKAKKNVVRINGWSGFLQRKSWEVAGEITNEMKIFFTTAGKTFIPVKDEPGLVAARTISMIINEAYFALGEEVSTKSEIDIAMKLGTNYPYGPFEWAEKIGLQQVFLLLATLAVKSERYLPAPQLEKEATA